MKYTFLILFLTGTLSKLSAQEISKEQIIKFQIKSITAIDSDKKVSVVFFNELGNKIKEGTIKDDNYQSDIEYQFDGTHQLIMEQRISSSGSLGNFIKFYYSDNGKLIKKEFYYNYPNLNKVSLGSMTTYEYDLIGNLVKETRISDTSGNAVTIYNYEEKKLIEEEVTNETIGKEEKSTYKYDEEGLLIKKKTTFYFSNTTVTQIYSYDLNKRLVSIKEKSSNGVSSLITYNYNQDGLLVSDTWKSSMGKETYQTDYKLDY